MFRFASSEVLYFLLLLLPLVVALYAYSTWRKAQRERLFGDRKLLHTLSPGRSTWRPLTKFLLCCLALCLSVLILARPQYGTRTVSDHRKGIEAVIVLDVSNSMLADDVTPTRLDRCKLLVSTLIERMQNDKVGLAVFAGEAYSQLPITNDYVSAKMFLEGITTGMVSLQGTNIAAAINLASRSFTQAKDVGKAIIIITDGEDHEGGAIEAAEAAAKAGQRVYMLGVGSAGGAQIHTADGVLTDGSGAPVVTRLNEDMCREVAEAGKGAYIHIDNSNLAQDQLQAQLGQLKQKESGVSESTALDEQFQAVALILLIVLLVELFLREKQNPLFTRLNLFRKP